MNPFLKLFDVIPGWVYAAALALVVIGGGSVLGMQTVRLAGAKTEIAELKTAAEKDRGDRLQLVADHNLKIAGMQAAHAKQQQEIIGGFIQLKIDNDARHVSELAAVRRHAAVRVRDAAEAAAARDRETARSNPASCGDLADRNAALYGLLAEGHELAVANLELAVEGRAIVGRRDAEVAALKSIIANDRAAICASAP